MSCTTRPLPARFRSRPSRPGQPSEDAALTLVFDEADRAQAIAAMQRLKTIMLRYGVQIDSIRLPGDEGKAL